MLFLVKILGILALAAVNMTAYIVLSFMALGLEPKQTLEYAKMKFQEVTTDSLIYIDPAMPDANEVKSEIEQAQITIDKEREELDQQKQKLIQDKNELEQIRAEVQQLMSQRLKDDDDKMYKLAKIYDGMEQESVADVFAKMPDTLVVAIIPKMKPKNASRVLEFLPAERSAELSRKILEGR